MLEKLIIPSRLKPGDKIAAVTLSWGGPGSFPYRFEIGKQRIEQIFGLHVVTTPHALKSAEWIHNNPQARADDLMEAFADPTIKGIISTIGGTDSHRLIPLVDLSIITHNPKIFLGFSDTTVIHYLCLKSGLRSFYGPSVMTGFAENMAMHDYTIQGIRTLFDNPLIIPQNPQGWTTQILNWADQNNQAMQRVLQPPTPWKFMGSAQIAQGRLIGGCMEILADLIKTDLWPDQKIWDQAILFVETSGGSASAFTAFLSRLADQNILQQIQGLLLSKPGSASRADQWGEYEIAILAIFSAYNIPPIPCVTRMDFGHSDPMWVMPYGLLVQINPEQQVIKIIEDTVR